MTWSMFFVSPRNLHPKARLAHSARCYHDSLSLASPTKQPFFLELRLVCCQVGRVLRCNGLGTVRETGQERGGCTYGPKSRVLLPALILELMMPLEFVSETTGEPAHGAALTFSLCT